MAAAAAEAKAEAAARRLSSESGDVAERAIQKAAWEAGAAASVASATVPEQQRRGCADDANGFKEILPGGSGGHRATGNSTAGGSSVVTISRETSGMSSFSSTNSRGYPVPQGLGMRAGSGSKWEVKAARPKQQMGSIGYVQMGSRAGAGGAGQAGSYKRSSAAVEAPAASRFDLAGFVKWLDGGVLLTKINRQGRAKLRTLFYDEQNKMLWWNGPGVPGARFGSGSQRTRSSSLMSLRKEQPLPLASLIEVECRGRCHAISIGGGGSLGICIILEKGKGAAAGEYWLVFLVETTPCE